MHRRDFIRHSAFLSVIAYHDLIGSSYGIHEGGYDNQHQTRIANLTLATACSFAELESFYTDLLGFPVVHESEGLVSFQTGRSTLSFYQAESKMGKPWYHFAFNIPENQLLEAHHWLQDRCELIQTPTFARDSEYPIEIRHFPHWNAHSIFFWDPAGNLLEFIARHELNNASTEPFGCDNIINISEVAFVVKDQEKNSGFLQKKFGLFPYPLHTNFVWAIGDANGLLLSIPKRVWGIEPGIVKRFEVFPTQATIFNDGMEHKVEIPKYPYSVVSI